MEKQNRSTHVALVMAGRCFLGLWLVGGAVAMFQVVLSPVVILPLVVGLAWAHTRRPIPGLGVAVTCLVMAVLAMRLLATVSSILAVVISPFAILAAGLGSAVAGLRLRPQVRLSLAADRSTRAPCEPASDSGR